MRLLNVFTGRLEEYFGSAIPGYAILSHTWGLEEITFSDIQNIPENPRNLSIALAASYLQYPILEAGYHKVVYACRQAIEDGYQYIWIDTCCIDKSSSAELSEAINSMYDWYTQAGICYAYLEDVLLDNFSSSRWFTRGWTLQELLAPAHVTFFGKGWTRLGGKSDLANEISIATEIDWETLIYPGWLRKKSIAQRMCWASKRETTRLEDEAYCLFGIFGVKMPLLYGEGGNAFVRLQEEILKLSADQSLFAW
ncbi:heterokaryon incompatibility protein-domain-containing protein, partial [Leptodontidium sp. 2 PMI_412]